MSSPKSVYEDMSSTIDQDGYSDDDDEGWSDNHFSEVESSDNESNIPPQSVSYIQPTHRKYTEKASTPALPPRTHIVPPPTPPIRSRQSLHPLRKPDMAGSEANNKKYSKNAYKSPDSLLQATPQLKPVITGFDEDDGDYVLPTNKNKKYSKDPYKAPDNILQAMSQLKPVTAGCDEDDGDYVLPTNKAIWLQSKVSLNSPVTHKEMSARKKLPIPKPFNSSLDAESSVVQEYESFDWFHGRSNREDIKQRILQHQMNGMFAVRKSNQNSNFHAYSLTFFQKGHIFNFPIRTRVSDKKYALGYEKPNEPAFSSLEKLVYYFSNHKIKLANNEMAVLTLPLPKLR